MLVRDLQPTATDKWHKCVVTKLLGLLNYEVCIELIEGHTRQAHIDHLCPITTDNTSITVESSPSQQIPPESDIQLDNKRPLRD